MLLKRFFQVRHSRIIVNKKKIIISRNFNSPSICKPQKNLHLSVSMFSTTSVSFKNSTINCDLAGIIKNTGEEIEPMVPKQILDKNERNQAFMARSEQLLEKVFVELSSQIHQKHRVYRNTLEKVVNRVNELNFSTRKQGLLLLRCCGELLPDESNTTRMNLLQKTWNAIRPHTSIDVEHYNEILRVYIANSRTITAKDFIKQMEPVVPNSTTYELILRALCEAGDLNQSTEVLSNMKTMGLPATDDVFHSLIIGQGKVGSYSGIQEILTMMKSLKVEFTSETYTTVVKALIYAKHNDKIIDKIDKAANKGVKFNERQILTLVTTLAFADEYTYIPKILKYLPEEILTNPAVSPYMQSVSTFLVFRNHAMAALEIYNCLPLPCFGPKDDIGLHGRSLVRDCVKASVPAGVIDTITKTLMSTSRNPIALQNACEAALQMGKVPLALELFTRMKHIGLSLRPHYFWPIILHNSKTYGEKGVMQSLTTMIEFDVPPDYSTMKEFVLPHVSLVSPQNLMRKLIDAGVVISDALTPMMECLLKIGQVRAASDLSELFNGKLDGEKLIKPLVKSFQSTQDVLHTTCILSDCVERPLQKGRDWPGRFLCQLINKSNKDELNSLERIVKAYREKSLKISTTAYDYCIPRIQEHTDRAAVERIKNNMTALLDEQLEDPEVYPQAVTIPHPKRMDEQSLRAHLVELEAKGMNTRGVLRKLLQLYCREGKLQAAKEMLEKCEKEGVFLSPGMKAAIFDLHVKLGELEQAETCLADLKSTSPNFTLDEHKVLDFATLLIYKKKIGKAFKLINDEVNKRHIVGGRGIELNCWRLLDATATNGTYEQTKKMFDLLVSSRFCKPSNVTLGPLVRVHLNNGDNQAAIDEFEHLSNEYNKTPLKHELLCKVLTSLHTSGDDSLLFKGNGQLNKAVQRILDVCKKVHGPGDLALSLIAALADVGYKKTLRQMLLDPTFKFHPDAFRRRCERFAEEKKVHALLNLAECAKDIRNIDVSEIYETIYGVYQRDDNVKGALETYLKIQEQDVTLSQKCLRTLCTTLSANNQPIPPEISALLEDKSSTREQIDKV